MRILKIGLIALSILMGVLCFYEGLGLEFRILDYGFLDKFGIPTGIALIVLGALMSRFWAITD